MFFNGFLLCCQINLNALLNSKVSLETVSITPDLTTFSALYREEASPNVLKLTLIVMPVISTCFEELEMISHKFSILQGILSYLADTIKQLTEAWETIVVEMDSKLESYANNMQTPEPGAMAADFLELLMFGTVTDALHDLMLQDLSEKGLKKLESSTDNSYLNVQRLVLKYLHVVSQSLNFYLAEMNGMSKANDKFEVLNISTEGIVQAQRQAASFWSKGLELQQVIDESRRSFKTFFRWLRVESLKLHEEMIPPELSKMSQQDINHIAEFLANFDIDKDSEEVGNDKNILSMPSVN